MSKLCEKRRHFIVAISNLAQLLDRRRLTGGGPSELLIRYVSATRVVTSEESSAAMDRKTSAAA